MKEKKYRGATAQVEWRLDAEASVRHEYWNGEGMAMAGETYNHSAVKDDLIDVLRRHTACDVLASGLRMCAPGYGRDNYAYPDGIVMCAPKQFDETTSRSTGRRPACR